MAAMSLNPRASAFWPTMPAYAWRGGSVRPRSSRSVVNSRSSFAPRGRKMAQSSPMPATMLEPRGIATRCLRRARMLSSVNSTG